MKSQPHTPFPEELRRHRDRLQISRRWLFGASTGLYAVESLRP